MTCHEVQGNLSLYLYGELDFAKEEQLEQHLGDCAFCQLALNREKAWHTSLNSQAVNVPLDLLAECRQNLKIRLGNPARLTGLSDSRWFSRNDLIPWGTLKDFFRFAPGGWSGRLAAASFFVFLGFTLSHWVSRFHPFDDSGLGNGLIQMGLAGNGISRVRDVRPVGNNRVHIIVDRVQQQEVVGSIDDNRVRTLLLAAAKDPIDPSLRVDCVEILIGQDGTDVRDALLESATRDPNAAVRLKALEGLRRFSADNVTRAALMSVLQHDDNPGVRSQAIEALIPSGTVVTPGPDLTGVLEQIVRSDADDDYVRSRCLQILRATSTSGAIY